MGLRWLLWECKSRGHHVGPFFVTAETQTLYLYQHSMSCVQPSTHVSYLDHCLNHQLTSIKLDSRLAACIEPVSANIHLFMQFLVFTYFNSFCACASVDILKSVSVMKTLKACCCCLHVVNTAAARPSWPTAAQWDTQMHNLQLCLEAMTFGFVSSSLSSCSTSLCHLKTISVGHFLLSDFNIKMMTTWSTIQWVAEQIFVLYKKHLNLHVVISFAL